MITGSYLKKIISCVLIINLLILCGCGDSGATPSTRENTETKEEYEASVKEYLELRYIQPARHLTENIRNSLPTHWVSCPEQIIPISRMARRMKIMLIQGC